MSMSLSSLDKNLNISLGDNNAGAISAEEEMQPTCGQEYMVPITVTTRNTVLHKIK